MVGRKLPQFMTPKTLFSGLTIAGAVGLSVLAGNTNVSADTISVNRASSYGNGMMYAEKDGVPSWSTYEVLKLNDRVVFCMDPWTAVEEGADYDYNDSKYTQSVTTVGKAGVGIDEAKFRKLELIAYYGYYGASYKPDWKAVFTQMMIWEELGYTPTKFTGDLTMDDYNTFKNEVLPQVENHKAYTSWNGTARQIKKGETIQLTDENNVVQKLDIPSSKDGYTFSLNGNVLSITATEEASSNQTNFAFSSSDKTYEGLTLVWYKYGSQTVGEFKIKEGNYGSITFSPETPIVNPGEQKGSYSLQKFNTDKETLKDVEFSVFKIEDDGTETKIGAYTTDEKGLVTVQDLVPGKYYIKETKALEGYKLDETKRNFTIVGGEQATQATATMVVNERVPVIQTDATNFQTGSKSVYSYNTKKEVAHLTNLDIGKTYTVRTYENDRDTKKERIQVQEKKIVATAYEMDVEFEYPVLEETIGHWTVFGEELLDEQGKVIASNFDWDNERETVRNRNPKLKTTAQVNGQKVVNVGEDGKVSDTIKYEDFEKGTEVHVRLEIAKYGTEEIVGTFETTAKVDESGELVVDASTLNTKDLPEGKYVLFETVFETKDGKPTDKVISKERDPKNEDQSFEIKKPTGELPKTGAVVLGSGIVVLGLTLVGTAGALVFSKKKKENQ